jgi:hypothetical protein
VGYTVAMRGYRFREGQPAGPVIAGHADPIDHLLEWRACLLIDDALHVLAR